MQPGFCLPRSISLARQAEHGLGNNRRRASRSCPQAILERSARLTALKEFNEQVHYLNTQKAKLAAEASRVRAAGCCFLNVRRHRDFLSCENGECRLVH